MSDYDPAEGARLRWMLAGFVLFFALPASLGVYGLVQDSMNNAALPKAPNSGVCGMGTLALIIMVVVVGPICGLLGGLIGSIVADLKYR